MRLIGGAVSNWTCRRAFTLAEVMIASAVIGLSFVACCSAVLFDQVSLRKAKERAIAMDFLIHYAENVKALPFNGLTSGVPINSLYNGADGAPKITIPPDNSWVPVNTSDFLVFHPDLLWFSERNPQMQVALTPHNANGVLHDIEMNVKLSWNAPLQRGGRETAELELFRGKDL
jgi:prepilin-type N-terminal cleavage/methylation domain-containing protein